MKEDLLWVVLIAFILLGCLIGVADNNEPKENLTYLGERVNISEINITKILEDLK